MKEDVFDKLLESIAAKGLSIVDKVLGKIDEKLDDEEFIKKLGKYVKVNIETEGEDIFINPKKENLEWEDMSREQKDKIIKIFKNRRWM